MKLERSADASHGVGSGRIRVLPIFLTLFALYLLVCIAVYAMQRRLMFFPGGPPQSTPADVGLTFDDMQLATKDGESIHAWRVRATDPRGALVLCHGNAGNIEGRLDQARAFVAMGFDVLLFDYRGYGGSSGTPSEEGLYLDAEAALEALLAAGYRPNQIVAYGESLGGAVAIELARRHPVGALVVEDTFTSMGDMAADVYPWLPVRLLLRYRFASIEKVGAVSVPFLVIHSPVDDLIPFSQGERLFAAAHGTKQLLKTTAGHNGGGFVLKAEWRDEVRAFLHAAIAR